MNKLAIRSFAETQSIAEAMAQSGFFADSKQAEQAIVKVLAGEELGIGPFASMTGINVIKGKPALGANLIATLIKNDPRYDYRVTCLDDTRCEITFYEGGKETGVSEFTAKDLELAEGGTMVAPGASKPMKTRFPRNMLFARAMTNGAKWYVPGVFGGMPVYTPEELGADMDDDGGYIIEGTTHEITDRRSPAPGPKLPSAMMVQRYLDLCGKAQAMGVDYVDISSMADYPSEEVLTGHGINLKNRLAAFENTPITTAIVQAGLAENEFAAATALKKCTCPYGTVDLATAWMRKYRTARDAGQASDEAALTANNETEMELVESLR